MFVVKKNGELALWNLDKVEIAIAKAARRINVEIENWQWARITGKIWSHVNKLAGGEKGSVTVEQVHGAVELVLREECPPVAESYSNYRNYRKDIVEVWESIFQKTRDTLYLGDRENANFNSALISTKGSLVRGHLTKELFRRFYLSPEEIQIIEDGYVYIHDLRDLIFGGINCCLFDMTTVLRGGFEMSGVRYKEPKSVLSALQVIGDITLVATAQQFGGFTIPEIDRVLAPYAHKSWVRLLEEAQEFGVDDPIRYATKKLDEEINQGCQSLEMKLNTVPSSRGDTAFVTVSFGNVDPDDELASLQRAICRAILNTRMRGQGNGSPVVFPKLVYLHSEKQHEDPEQAKLFDFAIECSSKSMYPDYLSLDAGETGRIFKQHGKVVSPMGCRAYLSEFADESGETYFEGRANVGAVSLNLPMIWKKSDGEHFYADLDHYLGVARRFLQRRYEAVANNPASTNPLGFTQGGFRGGDRKPDEKVGYDIVRSFTASFGITALNELNVLMEGKPLHESDRKMVEAVVDYIAEQVKGFKQEDGWLYALYATPAESLAGTQARQFREKFGVITGVSDKEYFSNGFHCPVDAQITPFQKQDFEFDLFHKINGGHIQYCRLDNPRNLDAIKTVVKRGMRMGFYQGVNFDLTVCEDCGFRPTKIVKSCPNCGSHDITVTSRVCGYLGVRYSNGGTRFNDSKLAECADRVSM